MCFLVVFFHPPILTHMNIKGDVQLKKLIGREERRQREMINLIASENIVSDDVLAALGSATTNKYAEGYPGKRYYAGNEIVDEIERLAIQRALKLFELNEKMWGINVQALSGSPANLAVLHALVPLGAKIMGMKLSHGGHLTHGHPASLTGKLWKQVAYTVNPNTERLNYETIRKLAKREKPALIIAGYTAYPRTIQWKKFRSIVDEVGALLMVDMSHIAGLIAGGVHPSPFRYADVVTTTTHKTLRGPRGALIFARKKTKNGENLFEKIQKTVFPGLQGGPHMNAIAGIAVALKEAQSKKFHSYGKAVVENAKVLAETLSSEGWRIISGGTDNHLLLVDTWMNGKGIPGKDASILLEKNGIIVNMNTIPFDTRSPFSPSGIRIGTAMETTKGKGKRDMRAIGRRISAILKEKIAEQKGDL